MAVMRGACFIGNVSPEPGVSLPAFGNDVGKGLEGWPVGVTRLGDWV